MCSSDLRSTTFLYFSLVIAVRLMVLFACIAEAGGGGPKVVILEVHGMKKGTLDENLEGLPNFQEMLKGSNNDQPYVYLPRVFTTIPAASQPAVTSMYTGLYPQRTGVVSTIWFDRTTYEIRTLISYSQNRMNSILTANGVKTLFDYVGEADKHSLTTMLMLTKGADWAVNSGGFFWGNASVLNVFRRSEEHTSELQSP